MGLLAAGGIVTDQVPAKRALVAVGHTMLIALWAMLTRDIAHHDLRGDYFTERHSLGRPTGRPAPRAGHWGGTRGRTHFLAVTHCQR